MTLSPVISADSHVVEPDNLFVDALGARHGDKLPRMVSERDGEKGAFLYTGIEYIRRSGGLSVDDETEKKLVLANEDPSYQLECLDADGIHAEVLCATTMMLAMRAPDDDLVRDCCAVFNDWLADYCAQAPKRLLGTAMIHMEDIDWATRELDRIATAGMCCVMIDTDTRPGWLPYQDKHYDPFWARAEEAGILVMIHIACGNKRDFFTLFGDERKDAMRMSLELYAEGPITLANEFIFGGILDRFPNLKIVLGEFEISWLPNWLYRVEQMAGGYGAKIDLDMPKRPVREYMSRVYQGIIDDPCFDDSVLKHLDIDTLMWGSDFPHPGCTYPDSLGVIDDIFQHLSADNVRKVTIDNAARFYNIDMPA